MFKILMAVIFLTGSAFADFNISNIKLTPTELEIVGDNLQEITSLAIISGDSRKDFEIENISPNQLTARPLDDAKMVGGRVFNLVVSDSSNEFTYPVTLSQKNGSVAFYKLKEIEYKPAVNPSNKFTLDHKSIINFLPGDDFTGYDYNYSLYANPTGDFAIKGVDKDLFKIDSEGNVEISGTLKVKGRPVGFNIPYQPIKEQGAPSKSANKVAFSTGNESDYTIPMNICPKGQILKSDGVNFVCSLEASQEDQLGPVYTNNKGNFGIDSINRSLAINNVVIGANNNITGVVDFTSSGIMDVATGTFHVDPAAGGRVGIGTVSPLYKLDIRGAVNSGIYLKQAAQSTATEPNFRNGLVFENSADTKSVAIGYGVGDLFTIIGNDLGAYKTLFTLNGNGGSITGPLKIVGSVSSYTLPAADGAANYVLQTNGSGTVSWAQAAAGNVVGAASTTVGNIASWNNTGGTSLADGGKSVANLVTNNGTSTAGKVATFFDASGKIIQEGTKLEANLVEGPASASATNLAAFNGTTGKLIQDSGLSTASIPTMTLNATLANQMILSGGVSKQLVATPYTVPGSNGTTGQILTVTGPSTTEWKDPVGIGDVVGTSSSTINALVRYSSTTGKAIQTSPATLDDLGNLTGITSINGKTSADIVTMPTSATVIGQVMLSSGAGKAISPTPYNFPSITGTAGQVLKLTTATDATWQTIGGGDVSGPASSADNQLAVFVGTTGKQITNVPTIYLNLVTNTASSTVPNNIAIFDSATGKSIADSGKSINNLVTGPAGTTTGNLASYNGTTGYLIQDSTIATANVVQNTGATVTANAIPRFDSTTGRLIKNSPITVDDSGNLNGVGTINGNTATNIVTMTSTPTAANYVYLSNGNDKVAKTAPYTMPATACADTQILKANASGNLVCANDTSGVTTVFGRSGAVVAAAGDYTGALVTNAPSGAIAASNTQAAINELDTEKLALAGGTMTGTLIITPALQPAITLNNSGGSASELRFLEGGGTEYVGFKAGSNVAASIIWTLPEVAGASGTVLSNEGGGILSWKPMAGGDVTGPGSVPTGGINPLAYFDGTTANKIAYADSIIVGGPGKITLGKSLAIPGILGFQSPFGSAVEITAPSTINSYYSLKLPEDAPLENQIIKSDASGQLSWINNSTGDVTGPAIATSTSIALFNGTSGKEIQSSKVLIDSNGNMTGVGTITSTGDVTVTGNLVVTNGITAASYTNTSDRKLKKDITPFMGASEIVDKLVPVTFRWRKGDAKSVMGFIAQDLEKVIPDVVTISKTKDGEVRSYDISQVLALTLEALKETRAEVKMLQEKVRKLEEKK